MSAFGIFFYRVTVKTIYTNTPVYLLLSCVEKLALTVCYVNLFCLYKVPPIDSSSTEGIELDQSSFKGKINFSNIEFCYPSRPDIKVNA